MPAVKFTCTGHASGHGNFSTGDIFRGSEAMCRHLVEEAHCAEWHEAAAPAPVAEAQPADAEKPAKKTARAR
jgi:hypothetical protein